MSKVHRYMIWDTNLDVNKNGLTHRDFLKKKYEVEDNPKADDCYELAWDYGHSNGYNEVENYFSDLVWLITDYDGDYNDEPDYGDDEA